MRNSNGWYEEDCEWCKVGVVFYKVVHFLKSSYPDAQNILKNWFPDAYEKFFNRKLKVEESTILRKRAKIKRREGKWVVVSAITVKSGVVKVHACKGGRLENDQFASDTFRVFLVPSADYQDFDNHDHIIDPQKYKEIFVYS